MTNKYKQYLNTIQWQLKRQQIFDRARKNANSYNMYGVCEKCGYEPYKACLQVHHLTYDNIYNEKLEDLILLCPYCHKKIHEKTK